MNSWIMDINYERPSKTSMPEHWLPPKLTIRSYNHNFLFNNHNQRVSPISHWLKTWLKHLQSPFFMMKSQFFPIFHGNMNQFPYDSEWLRCPLFPSYFDVLHINISNHGIHRLNSGYRHRNWMPPEGLDASQGTGAHLRIHCETGADGFGMAKSLEIT